MKETITGCRYVLAVNNLANSVNYYKDKLGFQTIWEGDSWHFLARDAAKIMLGECPEDQPASDLKNHSYFAYLEIEKIDRLYEEYTSKQVEILSDIESKPWGQKEFSLKTVDGHRITFGEQIPLL